MTADTAAINKANLRKRFILVVYNIFLLANNTAISSTNIEIIKNDSYIYYVIMWSKTPQDCPIRPNNDKMSVSAIGTGIVCMMAEPSAGKVMTPAEGINN